MSTIEELRQQAKAAWKSGSLAATSVAQSALRAALTEAWKCGECCGEQNEQGWCMNVTISQQRGWRYGYYYAGSDIMWAGTFCEHSDAGAKEQRKYLTSELMEAQFTKRLLCLVFGWDLNRHGILMRKVGEMAKEVISVDQAERQLAELRKTSLTLESNIQIGLAQAKMIRLARAIVTQSIDELAELQGSPLGFQCDKAYTPNELLDPMTEALVRGLPVTGNCFNVISGRLYITLEGWQQLFRDDETISYPEVTIGEIEMIREPEWVEIPKEAQRMRNGRLQTSRAVPGIAKVEAMGSCRVNGEPVTVSFVDRSELAEGIDGRIAIRVNHGMTEDAVQGKARRRVLKALYLQAMGQADDGDDEGVIEGTYTESPEAPAPQPAITATTSAPPPEETRVSKMLAKFAELGVTVPQIRDRLKVDDLATIGEPEFSLLGTVYKAMHERGLTWEQTDE